MRAESFPPLRPAYNVVIVTLDRHAAGPAARVAPRLSAAFPGLTLSVHAAAEWAETPRALDEAREAIATADILIVNLLFLEEHIRAVLPDLAARRERCDALVGIVADAEVVRLTRMGELDMSKPASGAMALLKKLKPKSKGKAGAGASQLRMLRRIPRILKLVPGRAQDLRQWFLSMQYWLGGSDDNVENMVRALVSRYASVPAWREARAAAPSNTPRPASTTPTCRAAASRPTPRRSPRRGRHRHRRPRDAALLHPGLGHRALRRGDPRLGGRQGLRVLPAFAGSLDARPAIDAYFRGAPGIDALVSLTGFNLVGGPAYNDAEGAAAALDALDVPYLNAQPLEFQTLGQWARSAQGLGPVEATMLVALPEIDGAACPTVFAGRHGEGGCDGCAHRAARRATPRRWRPAPSGSRRWPRRCGGWRPPAPAQRRQDRGHRPLRLPAQRGRRRHRRLPLRLRVAPRHAPPDGRRRLRPHAPRERGRAARGGARRQRRDLRAAGQHRRPPARRPAGGRAALARRRSRPPGVPRRAASSPTGAASSSSAPASARSSSASSPPSATRATRCGCCSSAASRPPTPLRASTTG